MNSFCKQTFSLRWHKNQLTPLINRLYNFHNKNKVFTMNEAYFKHLPIEQKIAISFRFVHEIDSKKIDRVFNFVRDLNENLDVSLNRIRCNLEKELTKKSKKKSKKSQQVNEEHEPDTLNVIAVELHNSKGIISNITFAEILETFETENYVLNLHQIPFNVKFNWPWINTLTLPATILAGFYVYPAKLEIDFADRHVSEFIWFRGKLPKSSKEDDIEWEEIGKGFSFLIRPEDIGYRIKIRAAPKSKDGNKVGPTVETIGKSEVQAGPGFCPFEARHLFTMDRLQGSSLRVVSYNLLADYYADSEDGRTKLFCYCPEYALQIEYRKQLMSKEILGYNADLLALQEVDFKIFENDLKEVLAEQHLAGVHNKKGTTPEGVAIFYRTDRFELIDHQAFTLGDTVKTHTACQDLFSKLQYNEKLVERLTDLGTTLQVVVLKSKDFPGKIFTVANTHLYFHPDSDHIRLLQIGISMILVQDLIAKLGAVDNTLIFCGDFNSVPECGIYKLITENFIPEDFIDWSSNEEQAVKNVSLVQPFLMRSACGTPKFTNYTVGFQACLDYIFYQSDKLKVTKVVETPEEDELKAHIAIPSVVFPSDHVAIVAELEIL